MSLPAASPAAFSAAVRDPARDTRIVLLLVWAVAVFSLSLACGLNNLSTDDAMRLVEVRDLLAGQGWFDLVQHRLDPPAGIVMHWSRLVDLPLALAIRFFSLFVPTPSAEAVVLAVWPTALLLVLLAGVARLSRELAGHSAARVAIIFVALMAPVLQDFRTGAIHHHNVQLVLLLWMLALFVRAPLRPHDAALAGFLCALSVAVGEQMVPAVAALAAVAALRWVVDGERYKYTTAAFALAIAAVAVALAAVTVLPGDYLAVHCDAMSIFQVGCLALGGFGLAALAALPRLKSVSIRALAAGVLAALIVAFIKFTAPQCLGDPYAQLDPRLADLWLSSVAEARSFAAMLRDIPQQVPAYYGAPLAALVLGIIRCLQGQGWQQRWNWIAATAVQAALLAMSVWEVRAASGANALAAALLPASVLTLLPASAGQASLFGVSRPALFALLLLNPATLLMLGSGAAHALAAKAVTTERIITGGDAGTCQRATDYAPLASLPRGRVLAFIDAGPFILMETGDAVLAAPYHRNQAGNIAMLDMLAAAPGAAKDQMAARGIDYVAFCPGAPERYNYVRRAPESLVAALARNEAPGYLEKITPGPADLVLYRVRR
jgi:hypothetical protein